MGVLLGLLAGAGLVLVLLGLTTEPRRRGRRVSRLRRLVERSGVAGVTPAGVVGAGAAAGVVGALVALLVTALPAVALAAGSVGACVPVVLLRRRAAARTRALRAAWPDAVDALVSAVRAGMSLPEAVGDLARRGPEPLRPAFAGFAADWRASGSFGPALDALTTTLADPVADRVAASLRIAREVGGTDLGRVLRTLAEFLRSDARMRGEIEARQSWTVNAARLAVAAPWITLALLCTRPETVAAYATPAGSVVLAAAALASVVAYRAMLALGRLPDEPRVLR
jgi:tight adherence protein B